MPSVIRTALRLTSVACLAVLAGQSAIELIPNAGLSLLGRDAFAQGQGQGLNGGGHGSGSGGTTGGTAGPQGTGSGGTTAGSGNRATSGSSNGPGGVNQNRYGGGTTVTPPPSTTTDDGTTTTSTSVMQMLDSGGGNGGEGFRFSHRCADHYAAGLSPDKRITGNNLQFLSAAQGYLAPSFDPGNNGTGLLLLANYQEELEKLSPDPEVAGTYLGLTAARPVTEPIVARVNALLCVTASAKITDAIAKVAETQRTNNRH